MSDEVIVSNVRKQAEYKTFLSLTKDGEIPPNWEDMAKALGVRPSTISDWKKLPEFGKALYDGIKESFDKMGETGKRDWRMWRERNAMLVKEMEKQQNNQTVNVAGDLNIQNVISLPADERARKIAELEAAVNTIEIGGDTGSGQE